MNDNDLAKLIKSALEENKNISVKSIGFDYSDDEALSIDVAFSFGNEKLPKSLMLDIVSKASNVVRSTNLTRYPIVRPKLRAAA